MEMLMTWRESQEALVPSVLYTQVGPLKGWLALQSWPCVQQMR